MIFAFLDETRRELRSHKREGLIPFPRIGKRSDPRNSALWFGPRLGRSVMVPDNYEVSYLDAGNMFIIIYNYLK